MTQPSNRLSSAAPLAFVRYALAGHAVAQAVLPSQPRLASAPSYGPVSSSEHNNHSAAAHVLAPSTRGAKVRRSGVLLRPEPQRPGVSAKRSADRAASGPAADVASEGQERRAAFVAGRDQKAKQVSDHRALVAANHPIKGAGKARARLDADIRDELRAFNAGRPAVAKVRNDVSPAAPPPEKGVNYEREMARIERSRAWLQAAEAEENRQYVRDLGSVREVMVADLRERGAFSHQSAIDAGLDAQTQALVERNEALLRGLESPEVRAPVVYDPALEPHFPKPGLRERGSENSH